MNTGPAACMERVRQAINAHDLDALTACFAPDYRSEFPAHPGRAFGGHAQLRLNWERIFARLPDIHAELTRCAVEPDGETVWTEWDWRGTSPDGQPARTRGVTLQGVRDERVIWTRLYMEPVVSEAPPAPGQPHRGLR